VNEPVISKLEAVSDARAPLSSDRSVGVPRPKGRSHADSPASKKAAPAVASEPLVARVKREVFKVSAL
jgi:hypothetical protein